MAKSICKKSGVAIGSKLGKNFESSNIRIWDEQLVEQDKTTLFYKRFIDDGFGVWTFGVCSLLQFRDHANNIHPEIKVVLQWSKEEIEFLDTKVKIANRRLITDLYAKPTDKHIYVDQKSNHPTSVKKTFPYGLGLWLGRICSEDKDYHKCRQELKGQLWR